MDILEIESFFANSSFFLLFSSMSSYWIQVVFSFQKLNFGRFFMICANFCLFCLLILRWKESGHFPLSNLYESLIFLSWSLSSFHFILENIESKTAAKEKTFFLVGSETKSKSQNEKKSSKSFLGALTSPPALFTNAFATFSLPIEMQHSGALVPALQSNWLMMHVTVMILSYSALICGSLLSIAFLIFTRNVDFDFTKENGENQVGTPGQESFSNEITLTSTANSASLSLSLNSNQMQVETMIENFNEKNFQNSPSSNVLSTKKKFAEQLDNLSYRILGIGFPFLTIGILSGAVWANEAWGSYWSWDPKETWALATWLVFAIYLHTRLTKGWKGKKPALIASLGFVTVWICFLGVNLLGEGLHSYGFFKDSLS